MKYPFTIFLLYSIHFLATAQSKSAIYIGLQGGGLVSSAYIEHTLYFVDLTPGLLPGGHGGIVLRVIDMPNKKGLKTGFESGLFLTEKGWTQTFRNDTISKATTRLRYLTVPFSAFIWSGSEKNKFYFTLGGFVEFLASHESKNAPDPALLGREVYYTYDPRRDNTLGYGVNVGVGTQKDFSFGAIFLEANVNFALSDFIGITARADPRPDISNLYLISGSVGYLFSLKRKNDKFRIN